MDAQLVEATVESTVTAVEAPGSGWMSAAGWRSLWQSCIMLIALVSAAMNGLGRISSRSAAERIPVVPASLVQTTVLECNSFIPEISITGLVVASEQTPVHVETSGRISEVVAVHGETVQEGSVILRLRSPELDNRLDEAQRSVADAERELKRLELRSRQEGVESQVTLVQSRNAYNDALRTHESDVELFRLGFLSRQKLRLSREREERLRLSFEALVHREQTAQKSNQLLHDERQTQLHRAQQRSQQLMAEVAALDVRAKVRGVLDLGIRKDTLVVGKQVSAWTEIGNIYQRESLQAEFPIDDAQDCDIEIGQIACIQFGGGNYRVPIQRRFRVGDRLVAVADLPLELLNNKLFSGSQIQGFVQGLALESATILPGADADYKSQPAVYRVRDDNAISTEVTWGGSNTDGVCVAQGLAAGDIIVTSDVSHFVGDAKTFRIDRSR